MRLSLIAIALVVVLFGAVSCGAKSTADPTSTAIAPGEPTATPANTPPASANDVEVGSRAGNRVPQFTMVLADGAIVTSDQLVADGRPVFLFFWATWCPTCRNELQEIMEVYTEFEERVTFYAVGQDPSETVAALAQTAADRGYPFPVAAAGTGMLSDLRIVSQSSKLAFDARGVITYRDGYAGGNAEVWRQVFRELAGESS